MSDPRRWLDALTNSIDDATIGKDLNGTVVIWNNAASTLFGYSDAEMIGRPIDIIVPPERCAEQIFILDRIRRGEPVVHFETERRRRDGALLKLALTVSAMRDRRGKIIGTTKVARPVNDVRRMRHDQRHSQAVLRSVYDAVPIALITVDEHGTIHSCSARAEQILGFLATEVIDHGIGTLMPAPNREKHANNIIRCLEAGGAQIIGTAHVVTGQRKDGTTFPMRLTFGEVPMQGERLFTCILQDVTEVPAVRRGPREARGESVHASQMSELGRMASTLAHEVTQPLTAIANYVDGATSLLLSGDRIGALQAMARVTQQAERARDIIQHLRMLTRKGMPPRRPEDLAAVIHEICELTVVRGTPDIGLSIQVADDARAVVIDKVLIQQVLLNLIRNAVDAMEGLPRRELSIMARRANDMVEVAVGDFGNGLPDHVRDRLFRPFVSSKPNGMGVGLSICQRILAAHGGTIRAGDQNGGGTVFTFTVPRQG